MQYNDNHAMTFWKCPDPLPASLQIELFSCPVKAGFPSPAEYHIDSTFDRNQLLIEHLAETFFTNAQAPSSRMPSRN